jgi:hypothetical protein
MHLWVVLQKITWNLWSLSWPTWSQYRHLHPTYVRSILILSSHLGVDFSSGVFTWGLHTIPFSVFGPKPCNLTWFAWCTFLHVAMVPTFPDHHSFCTPELCCPHLYDLTQLRHTQLVVPNTHKEFPELGCWHARNKLIHLINRLEPH